MAYRGVCVLLLWLLAGPAMAGPDNTTNRFINDSPSMLDWGLDKISRLLEGDPKYGRDMGVFFDWDGNNVVIFSSAIAGDSEANTFEDDCREWFQWVRSTGYVNTVTGTVYGAFDTSRYASMFGHSGFQRSVGGVEETDALKAMDKLISLKYRRTWLDDNFQTSKEMSCDGKLLASGFSVSRD